jgi:hypothetical protein
MTQKMKEYFGIEIEKIQDGNDMRKKCIYIFALSMGEG